MKIIRTVLGDISPNKMGVTDAHDHLIRSGGPEIMLDSAYLMDDENAATKEMESFIKAGGRTMVCMDPIGCGRNVPKMLSVANKVQGKGNIMMTTGFQKGSLYCQSTSFLATVNTNKIAELMIAEITEGMDIHSYNGPVVERGKAKAGLIKAGTSYRIITKLEEKAINVAAITQKNTGCAVSFHTDFGTMALESIDLIKKYGGNAEKVVLCHMQRNLDKYYHEQILATGATICFDEPNKAMYCPDVLIAENIRWLIEKGYGKQIVLGMDGGKREACSAYVKDQGIGNGLDYLLLRFVPILKKVGITDDAISDMLVNNPSEVFSIDMK
ncbi:MAG: phosphotriesterase [Anaerotignaceae bacterium]